MTTAWSLYSFDYARFQKGAFDPHIGVSKLRNFLSDPQGDRPERKLLTPEVQQTLIKGNFDYNTLPKKHWKLLDAYVRLYVRDVMPAEAESETPGSSENWQNLLRFYLDRNGKDGDIFTAFAGDGRRYGLKDGPKGWFGGLTDVLYKKPAEYLILAGDELDNFCRQLQVLFYVNRWDWPTYLPSQDLLKPIILEPFLSAREKGLAIFAVRTPLVKAGRPVATGPIQPEMEAKEELATGLQAAKQPEISDPAPKKPKAKRKKSKKQQGKQEHFAGVGS